MITGNRGEWSEIYTLFKLLGDGKVHAGDANMNKLELYYPIINIIRQESQKWQYKPNQNCDVVIINEEGEEECRIPMLHFLRESDKLLSSIKEGNKEGSGAFSIPATESFMSSIHCEKLKAKSTDKADIQIMIHDLRTNMTPTLGFSIKSQLGSPSTLLNAGETTNILYKVVGDLSDDSALSINKIKGHIPRMNALKKLGCTLTYADVTNKTFKDNLLFLDHLMPEFIAECLLVDSFYNVSSDIKEAVEFVANKNPLNIDRNNILTYYEHKMKQLLLSSALGMTPAKEWTGRFDANGGYLVVRKDGEIVCYHFYNQNDVEDYLYNNTRFERASRSRYHFGSLFKSTEDNSYYCILNLQIRFKK